MKSEENGRYDFDAILSKRPCAARINQHPKPPDTYIYFTVSTKRNATICQRNCEAWEASTIRAELRDRAPWSCDTELRGYSQLANSLWLGRTSNANAIADFDAYKPNAAAHVNVLLSELETRVMNLFALTNATKLYAR
jgi:hypothetical protein